MHATALHDLGLEVTASIDRFTPACFQNLLSKDLESGVGGSGEGLRIEPDAATILAKNTRDGVQFSMQGRMLVDDGTMRRVIVHGIRDDDMDEPGFRSIERLTH
jgi:hypothetical protein